MENPAGVLRSTLAFDDAVMLCHFVLKKGAKIPMHGHAAAQVGYLIAGRLRLVWESGRVLEAVPGDSWCFSANERHGAEVIEDCEAVECFAPARPEYAAG